MEKKLVKCSQISVDCTENNPADICAGGPEYIGFDFYVPVGQVNEMLKFTNKLLRDYLVPVKRIYINGNLTIEEKDVWTKKRITESIKIGAIYIINESKKDYARRR